MQVAAGDFHTCALKRQGVVICWGAHFQLYRDVLVWDMMEFPDKCANALTWVLCTQCPGGNDYGQCSVPSGLSDVVQVAAQMYHTCALKSTGTVVCWGAFLLEFACNALIGSWVA